jgi:sulfur carrier protein ThiS
MLNVRVKLYGLCRPYHPGPNRAVPHPVELADDAGIQELIAALNIPPNLAQVAFVNGERAMLDAKLNDGDEVLFFSSLVGG